MQVAMQSRFRLLCTLIRLQVLEVLLLTATIVRQMIADILVCPQFLQNSLSVHCQALKDVAFSCAIVVCSTLQM